jgi:hypothetical protein
MLTIQTIFDNFWKDYDYKKISRSLYPRFLDNALFIKIDDVIYTDDHGCVYPNRKINENVKLCTTSFCKFKQCFDKIDVVFFPMFVSQALGEKIEGNVFIKLWYTDYTFEVDATDISNEKFYIQSADSISYFDNMGRSLSLISYLLSMLIRSDNIYLFNLNELTNEFNDLMSVPELFGYHTEKIDPRTLNFVKDVDSKNLINCYKISKKQESEYLNKLKLFSFYAYFEQFIMESNQHQEFMVDNCANTKDALQYILDNMEVNDYVNGNQM